MKLEICCEKMREWLEEEYVRVDFKYHEVYTSFTNGSNENNEVTLLFCPHCGKPIQFNTVDEK